MDTPPTHQLQATPKPTPLRDNTSPTTTNRVPTTTNPPIDKATSLIQAKHPTPLNPYIVCATLNTFITPMFD